MRDASHVYEQCGLRVRSELELPLPLAPEGEVDVEVLRGDDLEDSTALPPGVRIASFGEGEDAWYVGTATEGGYILRFRGCGEFRFDAGLSRVVVRRDPGGTVDLLPILLAGTAFAFLLALRGYTVLHASAVSCAGRAGAFVGDSGRGKSTLAALMCRDGAELVADDVLALDVGPPVRCRGGSGALRLREKASDIGRLAPRARHAATADGRLAYMPPMVRTGDVPLVVVILPRPSREVVEIQTRRLPPGEAARALLACPRVHGWRDPAVLGRDFRALTALASTIPVYEATIPWGPPFDPAIAPGLRALFG